MNQVQNQKNEFNIKFVQAIDHLEIKEGLCVYRLKSHYEVAGVVMQGEGVFPKPSIEEGFAKTEEIERFKRDQAHLGSKIQPVPKMFLMKPGYKQVLKEQGYAQAEENYRTYSSRGEGDWFEKLASKEATLDDVVIDDISSNVAFDVDGQMLPRAMRFDYMNGGMHNGNYDMVAVLDVLLKNPQVVPVLPEGFSRYRKDEWDGVLRVTEIPFYNSGEEHSTNICFNFIMTDEQAKMIQKSLKSDKLYSTPVLEAIISMDLLGIEKYRI